MRKNNLLYDIRDAVRDEISKKFKVNILEIPKEIILNNDSTLIVEVNCPSDASVEYREDMFHTIKHLFESRGITKAIYIPANTIKITAIDSSKQIEYLE